jgi:pilus assembly protein CpaD
MAEGLVGLEHQGRHRERAILEFRLRRAAQSRNLVADPIDLVRPETEDRIDVVKRSEAIEKLRKGTDPATSYDEKNKATISTLGTN